MIFRKETKKTAETNFVDLLRIDFGDLLPLGSLDLRLVIAKRIESQQRQLTKPADNTRGLMPFSVCLPTPTKRKRKIEKQTFFLFYVGAQKQDKVQNNFSIILQWVLGGKESEHEPTIAQEVEVEQQLGSS